MKILAIRGSNLASLSGPFEVDLQREPLASAGLFAISGPTGAGKSTLLDALCLALYDATPRLLNAGSRGIDLPDVQGEKVKPQDTRTLLRRGTAEGHAEVDFVGSDDQTYRARWGVRRSRAKAEGALQKINMTLHHLPDMQAIGGTMREVKAEIEQRIGLSFDQFTRAVLLAQNEFSAFLKADDGERGELLETLTGNSIYSMISMRAFERERLEKATLHAINERLADHKPMAAEAREELAASSMLATQHLAQLEQRRTQLELVLRWHLDLNNLRQQEQLAQTAWQAGADDLLLAAPRQALLTLLDSAQPARPLLREIDRIAQDSEATRLRIDVSKTALENARMEKQAADNACEASMQALHAAEQSLHAATPQLEQARALDTRIESLAPSHLLASQACARSKDVETAAKNAHGTKIREHADALATQRASDDWLAANTNLKSLAESWPRWETLFVQVAETAERLGKTEHALIDLKAREAVTGERSLAASAGLDQIQTAVTTAQEKRTLALAALAKFDPHALQTEKRNAESRRSLLASAQTIWNGLSENHVRRQRHEDKVLSLQQSIDSAQRLQHEALQRQGGDQAALAQAERSLKIAEAACGESVETLRAALNEDENCPVCGALDHPYRKTNPQLHAILDGLKADVGICNRKVQDGVAEIAAQAATAMNQRTQLSAIRQEIDTITIALQRDTLAWDTHALVAGAGTSALATIAAADRSSWLTQQHQLAQTLLLELDQQEQACHLATSTKDQCQKDLEVLQAEHTTCKDAVILLKSSLTEIVGLRKANDEKRTELAQQRDTQLDALAVALDVAWGTDADMDTGWRTAWRVAPAQFQADRYLDVQRWREQSQARDQGLVRIATLEVEQKALLELLGIAQARANDAITAFGLLDAQRTKMQSERQQQFAGKAVREIATAFNNAIMSAKSHLNAHADIIKRHATSETRCTEALAQATQQLEALIQSAETAGSALASWLSAFNLSQAVAGTAAALDISELRALFTHTGDWVAAERLALQAIAAAATQATTVLAERQQQCERHMQNPPQKTDEDTAQSQRSDTTDDTGDDADGDAIRTNPAQTLQAALDTLQAERRTAAEHATVLQLSIAQDEARQQKSASMLSVLAQQEAVYRRWAQLSDLIGSADGKKFRNYAQQFTLDVLLGYANHHLYDLSRRYQLQRISDTLALMVVDQEMADEIRSVHSLSGGESFLVSLALALGLASLSSNRVKVESLFIDEGFGSLDADTLRVAMDALDGLQAMGRQVGVISHVQEMTDRIGAKVIVERVAGGRSRVVVQS